MRAMSARAASTAFDVKPSYGLTMMKSSECLKGYRFGSRILKSALLISARNGTPDQILGALRKQLGEIRPADRLPASERAWMRWRSGLEAARTGADRELIAKPSKS